MCACAVAGATTLRSFVKRSVLSQDKEAEQRAQVMAAMQQQVQQLKDQLSTADDLIAALEQRVTSQVCQQACCDRNGNAAGFVTG